MTPAHQGLARRVGHVVGTVATVGAGFAAVGLLALLIARPTGSVTTYVVIQSLIGLIVVVFVVRAWGVTGLRVGLAAPLWTGVPAAAAYVVVPSTWTGSALFGWQLLPAGVISWALDALLWCAAVGVGLLWATSSTTVRPAPVTPYS